MRCPPASRRETSHPTAPQQAGIRDLNHPMRKLISREEPELLPVACRRSLPFSRGFFSLHTSRMSFIDSSSQESVSLTWDIVIGVIVQAALKAEHPCPERCWNIASRTGSFRWPIQHTGAISLSRRHVEGKVRFHRRPFDPRQIISPSLAEDFSRLQGSPES